MTAVRPPKCKMIEWDGQYGGVYWLWPGAITWEPAWCFEYVTEGIRTYTQTVIRPEKRRYRPGRRD